MNTDIMQQAMDLCNNGRFDEAKPLFMQILQNNPNESEAWRMLAQIHLVHEGKVGQAENELIEALRLNPENFWALILMGNLQARNKNDFETAKNYYDRVLKAYPDNPIAVNNVGAMYVETQRYEEAVPLLKKALELDNTYLNSWYGLALCYYKQNKLQETFDTCLKGSLQSIDRPQDPNVREELLKLMLTTAQDLTKTTNYMHVWLAIKEELEEAGSMPIEIKEDKGISVLAKLEYGPWKGRDRHIIRYNPDKPHIDHLLVHEMGHLSLQQKETKAGVGKVFMSNAETIRNFNTRYAAFFRKNRDLFGTQLDEIRAQLAHGFALQLMNCPIDLFVEDWIYNHYPVMRPIQLLSLFNMEQDNISQANNKKVNASFPTEIVRCNKIMNMVTSMHFTQLFGIKIYQHFNPTKAELDAATDLYEEYKAYVKTYQLGDEYELIDYFASALNLEGLYEIDDEKTLVRVAAAKTTSEHMEQLKTEYEGQPVDDIDAKNAEFALNHQDGADPTETMMMSMYMLGAMEYLDKAGELKTQMIASEIALTGQTGINPKGTYSIPSVPDKKFGGYEFLAYYYESVCRAFPQLLDKLGLPFNKAHEAALQMYNARKKK